MDTKDLETFDPTVAELTKMVAATKDVTATDLEDKDQLELVKKNRIALKGARVKIQKRGKELREDALAFQKAVIAKEKELVGIIEPEEDRLAAIEEEAKELIARKSRLAFLPIRQSRLASIGDGIEVSDALLLEKDDTAFETYFNQRVADKQAADASKLEADRIAMEQEKQKLEREKERVEAEKNAQEREAKAREEERARAEADSIRKEQERVARESSEKAAAEKKAAEEKARLEKQENYRAFRAEHGWSEETKADYKEENTGAEIILWHKVGSFKLN